jgi:fumarate reductase flavoprotein subunit
MAVLVKSAEELGVEILLQTSGKKIIPDKQGKVMTVIAEKDGREFEIKTKSVIIATGGFPGNIEMLKRYCPDYYDGMYTGNSPYHTGDGITLAQEAGAEIVGNIPIFHVGPVVGSAPRGKLASIVKDPYAIWVNKTGRRFVDESDCMLWECGNAILMQPDRVSYCLFDDDIRKHMEERGIYDTQVWEDDKDISQPERSTLKEKLIEHSKRIPDEVKVSDSLDEMAAWVGADPRVLKSTVDEYNNACDEGHDSIFVKNKEFMTPLRTPPYYAIKGVTDCGETMGGVKVNEYMEAQDIKHETIPGIYVAGIIADGWESQTYCCEEMAGSAYGFAINSGRIAGENAASFALKNKKE